MKKGSGFFVLILAALFVSASTGKKAVRKEDYAVVAKQSNHIPPATTLPDYGALMEAKRDLEKATADLKRKNDSIDNARKLQTSIATAE